MKNENPLVCGIIAKVVKKVHSWTGFRFCRNSMFTGGWQSCVTEVLSQILTHNTKSLIICLVITNWRIEYAYEYLSLIWNWEIIVLTANRIFSKDKKTLVTCCKIWDVSNKALLARLRFCRVQSRVYAMLLSWYGLALAPLTKSVSEFLITWIPNAELWQHNASFYVVTCGDTADKSKEFISLWANQSSHTAFITAYNCWTGTPGFDLAPKSSAEFESARRFGLRSRYGEL